MGSEARRTKDVNLTTLIKSFYILNKITETISNGDESISDRFLLYFCFILYFLNLAHACVHVQCFSTRNDFFGKLHENISYPYFETMRIL